MPRFDEATKRRIDELVARYPNKRGALIPSLWVAQDVYGGWLPEEAMQEVADYIGVARAEVEGVATYYTMFNKEPVGKHHIEVCHNISCMIVGADDLVHHCERRLGIAAGQTTTDGQFTLSRVECLGACANALAIQIGPKYYENVTVEKMDRIIDDLKRAPSSEVENPAQAQMPEQTRF